MTDYPYLQLDSIYVGNMLGKLHQVLRGEGDATRRDVARLWLETRLGTSPVDNQFGASRLGGARISTLQRVPHFSPHFSPRFSPHVTSTTTLHSTFISAI